MKVEVTWVDHESGDRVSEVFNGVWEIRQGGEHLRLSHGDKVRAWPRGQVVSVRIAEL